MTQSHRQGSRLFVSHRFYTVGLQIPLHKSLLEQPYKHPLADAMLAIGNTLNDRNPRIKSCLFVGHLHHPISKSPQKKFRCQIAGFSLDTASSQVQEPSSLVAVLACRLQMLRLMPRSQTLTTTKGKAGFFVFTVLYIMLYLFYFLRISGND